MKLTLKELSKMSGYSCSTISRVISNQPGVKAETRSAVEKLLIESGYRTSVMELRMSEKKSHMILIVVGDLDNWYYMEIIRTIQSEALGKGYMPLIAYSSNQVSWEEEYVNLAIREHYAGILFVNVRGGDRLCKILEESGMPVVFLNRGIRFADFATILGDNYQGGYVATRCLIEMGHKRIGHLAGSYYSYTAHERQRGYEDAMRDANLPVTDHSIYVGNLDRDSGFRCAEHIAKMSLDFTAVFCANDLMAIGLMEGFAHYGIRVPEDVSVIGFDNTPEADRADLTTVGVNPEKMGKKAVDMLLSLIEDADSDRNSVMFRPELIVRDSVKKWNKF